MRSFHTLHAHHKRKTVITISAVLTALLVLLTVIAGFTVLDAQTFFVGLLTSLFRIAIAYFLSLILAIVFVLVATSSHRLEEILIPVFDVLQSFPSFALFPLLVAWFGKSNVVTIFILVITMIWPMLFTILTGRKELDEELLEAAQVYQARGWDYYQSVFFPLLLPSIVTGSIIAWGEAWETIIAAEIIVAVPGVGTYLAENASTHPQVLTVGIFALLVFLFLANKFIWLKLLKQSTQYQSIA